MIYFIFSETKKKVISQKDHLKRYLSGGKKKKDKTKIQKRYFLKFDQGY